MYHCPVEHCDREYTTVKLFSSKRYFTISDFDFNLFLVLVTYVLTSLYIVYGVCSQFITDVFSPVPHPGGGVHATISLLTPKYYA